MNQALISVAGVLMVALVALPLPLPGHAQGADLVVVDVVAVAKGYRASRLIGSSVSNDKNERIGTIDDLVVGEDTPQVLYAVLQVGGFLGLGGHLVAVSYRSLLIDNSGKITLAGASREHLRQLPVFNYHAG